MTGNQWTPIAHRRCGKVLFLYDHFPARRSELIDPSHVVRMADGSQPKKGDLIRCHHCNLGIRPGELIPVKRMD
jgi:hypothetical protein